MAAPGAEPGGLQGDSSGKSGAIINSCKHARSLKNDEETGQAKGPKPSGDGPLSGGAGDQD